MHTNKKDSWLMVLTPPTSACLQVLRKITKGHTMTDYWPRTVEWNKFREYVWEDMDIHLDKKKERVLAGGCLVCDCCPIAIPLCCSSHDS